MIRIIVIAAFLTGCGGAAFEPGADAGPAMCSVCIGPQYVVNSHVECTGTWVDEPCEVAPLDGGK